MKKQKSILKLLMILMTAFIIQSCYYDEYLPEIEEEIDPGIELSFSADIMPIFNDGCNTSGCHATGGVAPDLTPGNAYNALINGNYIDTTNPEASELYQWMRGNRDLPMPLEGPDAEANSKVLSWIKQGALDN